MYYLFLFFLIMFLGFFKIPMLGRLIDVLYFILLGYSLVKYIKIRKTIYPAFTRISELFIIVFFIYYSYVIISAPVFISHYKILNLRAVYPIGFYFITIACITSEKRLVKCLKVFSIACVLGGIITILQSLYGSDPMFDPEGFYNIGHWPGQSGMVGSIARVMLPCIYSIFILSIGIILSSIIEKRTKYIWTLLFFTIPIFISFARSLWGATFFAILTGVFLLIWNKVINTSKIVKQTLGIGIILLIGLGILPYIAPDLGESVSERFFSSFKDVENKSGTLEARLESSTEALLLWADHKWLGVDPFLMEREEMPELSDVGYTYVLTTIGLIGFILLILIWLTQLIQSVIMLKKAIFLRNNRMVLYSCVLFSSVFFWVISQQYLQYNFTLTLTFFIYGLTLIGHNIERQKELYLQIEKEGE